MKKILQFLLLLTLFTSISNAKEISSKENDLFNSTSTEVQNRYKQFSNYIKQYQIEKNLILETKDAYVYEYDMPGLDKSNVKMYISNNQLIIKGLKLLNKRFNKKSKREYNYLLNITNNMNIKKINAFMKNGVLKITINKLNIEENKKYIEIK